jgi:hypothetical protein
MKNQDSIEKRSEKDTKLQADTWPAATLEGETAPQAVKELTDEQCAAVVGGGKMAPDLGKKT